MISLSLPLTVNSKATTRERETLHSQLVSLSSTQPNSEDSSQYNQARKQK